MIPDRTLRRVLQSDHAVALYGDLIRGVAVAIVVTVIAFILAYHATIVRFMFTTLHMNDFGKFYYSARQFLDGQDMYGPNPATEIPVRIDETRQFWNMNPPHFHLAILPLARLSPASALAVWAAMNLLAFALSMAIMSRELQWTWTPSRALWAVLVAVVCSATGAVVVTGQLTFLLMLAVTLAWRASRRGHWAGAAGWLGLLTAIKPFLGVFGVYLLMRKKVWPAAVMAGVVTSSFAVGIAVFGVSAHQSWLGVISAVDWTWSPMNGSIAGFFSRTFEPSPFFAPLMTAPAVARFATLLATVVVLALSLRSLYRHRADVDRSFLLALMLALLVTPIGWVYYLWCACGPAAAVFGRTHRWSAGEMALAAMALPGLVCPLVIVGRWHDVPLATATVGSAYFWTTLALWLLAVREPSPDVAVVATRGGHVGDKRNR